MAGSLLEVEAELLNSTPGRISLVESSGTGIASWANGVKFESRSRDEGLGRLLGRETPGEGFSRRLAGQLQGKLGNGLGLRN